MKKRIYINDWLLFKPYEHPVKTDMYYLRICNDVKRVLCADNNFFTLANRFDEKEINSLACFLTSYFEDIISGTNIWKSFVRVHMRLYNKQLPFYDLQEYYEGEINTQEVCFLTWYFFNTIQDEIFFNPFNPFFLEAAGAVMSVFDDAWDHAPENDDLSSFYRMNDTERDFYAARQFVETVLFRTYLFGIDSIPVLEEKNDEIITKYRNDEKLMFFLNENTDALIHHHRTRLLAFTGKEWAAEIIGESHPLKSDFLEMSPKIQGYFLYKGQDQTDVFIEHIASGKRFHLTKKSFDHADKLKVIDTIIFIGIVKWKGEWWFSGTYFQAPFNKELVAYEKSSIQSRAQVNFLDHQSNDVDEMLKQQEKAFLDFNHGSPIAFLPVGETEGFMKAYMEFFNKSLNLSEKEIKESEERIRKEGMKKPDDQSFDFPEDFETGLVFFNPKSGCEMVFEVNSAFPLPDNPYFRPELSEEHIQCLLMDESISSELVMFCIDNCREELPFFNAGPGQLYLEDIDFLLRFWKRDNYYTLPAVTLIGQKE
ncbi:DUF3843 family protein [Proteiniphilum sp. X52]|uniref:DUF3843 family protein n=1 Tax=Proteiniphilum sp. X52 TaxID=2382159 RepID=UPI001C88A851|nr:DUF3843 family protein [Proteiniphilum sp. X52]